MQHHAEALATSTNDEHAAVAPSSNITGVEDLSEIPTKRGSTEFLYSDNPSSLERTQRDGDAVVSAAPHVGVHHIRPAGSQGTSQGALPRIAYEEACEMADNVAERDAEETGGHTSSDHERNGGGNDAQEHEEEEEEHVIVTRIDTTAHRSDLSPVHVEVLLQYYLKRQGVCFRDVIDAIGDMGLTMPRGFPVDAYFMPSKPSVRSQDERHTQEAQEGWSITPKYYALSTLSASSHHLLTSAATSRLQAERGTTPELVNEDATTEMNRSWESAGKSVSEGALSEARSHVSEMGYVAPDAVISPQRWLDLIATLIAVNSEIERQVRMLQLVQLAQRLRADSAERNRNSSGHDDGGDAPRTTGAAANSMKTLCEAQQEPPRRHSLNSTSGGPEVVETTGQKSHRPYQLNLSQEGTPREKGEADDNGVQPQAPATNSCEGSASVTLPAPASNALTTQAQGTHATPAPAHGEATPTTRQLQFSGGATDSPSAATAVSELYGNRGLSAAGSPSAAAAAAAGGGGDHDDARCGSRPVPPRMGWLALHNVTPTPTPPQPNFLSFSQCKDPLVVPREVPEEEEREGEEDLEEDQHTRELLAYHEGSLRQLFARCGARPYRPIASTGTGARPGPPHTELGLTSADFHKAVMLRQQVAERPGAARTLPPQPILEDAAAMVAALEAQDTAVGEVTAVEGERMPRAVSVIGFESFRRALLAEIRTAQADAMRTHGKASTANDDDKGDTAGAADAPRSSQRRPTTVSYAFLLEQQQRQRRGSEGGLLLLASPHNRFRHIRSHRPRERTLRPPSLAMFLAAVDPETMRRVGGASTLKYLRSVGLIQAAIEYLSAELRDRIREAVQGSTALPSQPRDDGGAGPWPSPSPSLAGMEERLSRQIPLSPSSPAAAGAQRQRPLSGSRAVRFSADFTNGGGLGHGNTAESLAWGSRSSHPFAMGVPPQQGYEDYAPSEDSDGDNAFDKHGARRGHGSRTGSGARRVTPRYLQPTKATEDEISASVVARAKARRLIDELRKNTVPINRYECYVRVEPEEEPITIDFLEGLQKDKGKKKGADGDAQGSSSDDDGSSQSSDALPNMRELLAVTDPRGVLQATAPGASLGRTSSTSVVYQHRASARGPSLDPAAAAAVAAATSSPSVVGMAQGMFKLGGIFGHGARDPKAHKETFNRLSKPTCDVRVYSVARRKVPLPGAKGQRSHPSSGTPSVTPSASRAGEDVSLAAPAAPGLAPARVSRPPSGLSRASSPSPLAASRGMSTSDWLQSLVASASHAPSGASLHDGNLPPPTAPPTAKEVRQRRVYDLHNRLGVFTKLPSQHFAGFSGSGFDAAVAAQEGQRGKGRRSSEPAPRVASADVYGSARWPIPEGTGGLAAVIAMGSRGPAVKAAVNAQWTSAAAAAAPPPPPFLFDDDGVRQPLGHGAAQGGHDKVSPRPAGSAPPSLSRLPQKPQRQQQQRRGGRGTPKKKKQNRAAPVAPGGSHRQRAPTPSPPPRRDGKGFGTKKPSHLPLAPLRGQPSDGGSGARGTKAAQRVRSKSSGPPKRVVAPDKKGAPPLRPAPYVAASPPTTATTVTRTRDVKPINVKDLLLAQADHPDVSEKNRKTSLGHPTALRPPPPFPSAPEKPTHVPRRRPPTPSSTSSASSHSREGTPPPSSVSFSSDSRRTPGSGESLDHPPPRNIDVTCSAGSNASAFDSTSEDSDAVRRESTSHQHTPLPSSVATQGTVESQGSAMVRRYINSREERKQKVHDYKARRDHTETLVAATSVKKGSDASATEKALPLSQSGPSVAPEAKREADVHAALEENVLDPFEISEDNYYLRASVSRSRDRTSNGSFEVAGLASSSGGGGGGRARASSGSRPGTAQHYLQQSLTKKTFPHIHHRPGSSEDVRMAGELASPAPQQVTPPALLQGSTPEKTAPPPSAVVAPAEPLLPALLTLETPLSCDPPRDTRDSNDLAETAGQSLLTSSAHTGAALATSTTTSSSLAMASLAETGQAGENVSQGTLFQSAILRAQRAFAVSSSAGSHPSFGPSLQPVSVAPSGPSRAVTEAEHGNRAEAGMLVSATSSNRDGDTDDYPLPSPQTAETGRTDGMSDTADHVSAASEARRPPLSPVAQKFNA